MLLNSVPGFSNTDAGGDRGRRVCHGKKKRTAFTPSADIQERRLRAFRLLGAVWDGCLRGPRPDRLRPADAPRCAGLPFPFALLSVPALLRAKLHRGFSSILTDIYCLTGSKTTLCEPRAAAKAAGGAFPE